MSLSKNEIKLVKSLQMKKYRDLHQLFVVEGVKLVEELFEQSTFKIDGVFHTPAFEGNIPRSVHTFQISESELERISGLKTPNKVLAVVKYPEHKDIDFDEENLILILDNINDPGNLGTIIRTADWFGVHQVIASPSTVDLFNPKVIQSSMGAVYRINYHRDDLKETCIKLKNASYRLMGADLGGENLFSVDFPQKTALIMGSESHGISEAVQEILDLSITIPQFGKTESLNVAMASGIILSHYKRKL